MEVGNRKPRERMVVRGMKDKMDAQGHLSEERRKLLDIGTKR